MRSGFGVEGAFCCCRASGFKKRVEEAEVQSVAIIRRMYQETAKARNHNLRSCLPNFLNVYTEYPHETDT